MSLASYQAAPPRVRRLRTARAASAAPRLTTIEVQRHLSAPSMKVKFRGVLLPLSLAMFLDLLASLLWYRRGTLSPVEIERGGTWRWCRG
jgi:hypothetical protein